MDDGGEAAEDGPDDDEGGVHAHSMAPAPPAPADQPNSTAASSYRLCGTTLSRPSASSNGTCTIWVPRRATIRPQWPERIDSITAMPYRVASTRSYAVGVPP